MTGPVFVVGPMRSGTTLLRLALDAHPDLAIPEETSFMLGGAAVLRIPGWRYGDVWFERIGLTRDDLVARVRSFYDGLFSEYAARQGATRWGEKTPGHVFHMELLAEVFPDARFVGIVRHPAAVVSSMVTTWHREPPTAASYWYRAATETVRAGRALGDDRFLLVRYEDLVVDPGAVLRDVCRFAGLAWDPAVLQHGEVHRQRGGPALTDGGTDPQRAVDPAAISSWTDRLDPVARSVVERETGPLARWLGYDVSRPEPEPLEADGTRCWSLSASALDQRAGRPGAPGFERQTEDPLDLDADQRSLAERAARAERDLAIIRRRRAVRLVDAIRRAQREGAAGTLRRTLFPGRSAQR